MKKMLTIIAVLLPAIVAADSTKPQMSLVAHNPHDLTLILDSREVVKAYPAKEIAQQMAQNIRQQMVSGKGLVALEVTNGTAWIRNDRILGVMIVKHRELKEKPAEPPKPVRHIMEVPAGYELVKIKESGGLFGWLK